MEFLKALFESGALTWEQFSEAVTGKGYKLADLSTGNYVSKKKFDDELKAKDTTITDLNGQIATRDGDITKLKEDLEKAGNADSEALTALKGQLDTLQQTYKTEKSDFEERLNRQTYEFAVKEFANGKEFSSTAAKRDFISQMLLKELKMDGDKILGAEDFVTSYTEQNKDAFVVKTEGEDKDTPLPTISKPTPPSTPPDTNAFMGAFQFTGVRPHEEGK